jgi:hypothetical protein
MPAENTTPLTISQTFGQLADAETALPLHNSRTFRATVDEDGLGWDVPTGTLTREGWLTMDMLADGVDAPVFQLRLHEDRDNDEPFVLAFGLLNACQARIRVPLTLCDGDVWLYHREGAWLKPTCAGRPVNPARVTRIELRAIRLTRRGATWAQSPLAYSPDEPPRLTDPLLPKGALVDELGQWTLKEWEGKSDSADEVDARLREQAHRTDSAEWPVDFSPWGGWTRKRFEKTGFFHTVHDGSRWWLADPDGCAFFSSGVDCVNPGNSGVIVELGGALQIPLDPGGDYADAFSSKHDLLGINYLAVHMRRAFGEGWQQQWERLAVGLLREWGFNTVANWSKWEVASRARMPYVRPMRGGLKRTPKIFRDFPDVFSDEFETDVREFAQQLTDTRDDPAMIGYFLMNEPKWGFAAHTPAEGMLRVTDSCATRDRLADWLTKRYGLDEALGGAWGMDVSLADIRKGRWDGPFTKQALEDLEAFSAVMVDRLFGAMVAACREVDPNHLNLGARYYTIPPGWALAGMGEFDVFSINCYETIPPLGRLEQVSRALGKPMLIGEWHFGAQDVGLPCSGICRVASQADRGKAFRRYLENSAACGSLVGVHYFQFNDQSVLGRFDGENYNIGLLDVCHRPYIELTSAARASHERLYAVAAGQLPPYDNKPDYRQRLFY